MQLSMDFSSPAESVPSESEFVEVGELIEASYELLDYQLANLMIDLNAKKDKTLNYCALEISKHTREGQIAVACTAEQQETLLNTRVVGKEDQYKPLILSNDYLYLRRYWNYQKLLSDQINKRLQSHQIDDEQANWFNQRVDYYFDKTSEEIDWQKEAAKRVLEHDLLVLSGGPGTGKTTTITRIIALLIELYEDSKCSEKYTSPFFSSFVQNQNTDKQSNSIRILLAAPTGKAAINMVDAIRKTQQSLKLTSNVLELMPTKASTIHKMLGYIHGKVGFVHNRNNPLQADVVIVDEASMIDIALMSKLIDALPSHAKLILIGDKDQLSSVEIGTVFTDICNGLEATRNLVTLQKNWRFSKESGIGQLAITANEGQSQKFLEILHSEDYSDCRLTSPHKNIENQFLESLIVPWRKYFDILNNPDSSISEIFDAFNQYRILCALRVGLNGSVLLSKRIEAQLAKKGYIQLTGSNNKNWYHGRPVMINQNSYSKGLFNGDTGITLVRNGKTKVYFLDNEQVKANDLSENCFKSIAPIRLPAHETNWSMTIHKSQGSEFNEVTLILPDKAMPLLTKQLIYTGVTRAKKVVNIVANEQVIETGIEHEAKMATRIGDYLAVNNSH